MVLPIFNMRLITDHVKSTYNMFSSKLKVMCGLKTLIRPHREGEGWKFDLHLEICISEPEESGQEISGNLVF